MSLPANMTAQAATRSTTWAPCCKIKLTDGTIFALTDHDRPLTVDLGDADGPLEYSPADAVSFSDGRRATDLAIDTIEVIGAVSSDKITQEDLHLGRFEDAEVTMFEVDW